MQASSGKAWVHLSSAHCCLWAGKGLLLLPGRLRVEQGAERSRCLPVQYLGLSLIQRLSHGHIEALHSRPHA